MGEIAEMMLNGDLCEGCGVYMGSGDGFSRRCNSCCKEQRADNHQATLARHQQVKKVPCPTCGKKVKGIGLADHQRDAHGVMGTPAPSQRERDFDDGWRLAAKWANRDDLLADLDSPAYAQDRAAALGAAPSHCALCHQILPYHFDNCADGVLASDGGKPE